MEATTWGSGPREKPTVSRAPTSCHASKVEGSIVSQAGDLVDECWAAAAADPCHIETKPAVVDDALGDHCHLPR
jgi:hypothetical protein